MPAPRPSRPRRSGCWFSNPTRGTRCRLLCGPGCVRRRTRRDNPPAATSRRTAPRRRRSRPARSPSPHVRDRSAPPARRPNRPGCARCGTATARARSCAAWESRRCPEGSRRTPRPAPLAPARRTDRRAARQHQPCRTSSGDHHRVPGHRRTPAGITPPAAGAPSARNRTATPTICSTSPRDPYVDDNTRISPPPLSVGSGFGRHYAARPGA
jgi:hypothetical protein